jgi:protein-tyrosine-phosphatase
MNILFVCTGNISRSFLAKALLLNEINKKQIKGINVSSAGTGAYPGTKADPEMIRFLRDKKIPEEEHSSRIISKDDIDRADLILVMEDYHYKHILGSWPEAEHKIEMLAKYIAPDQSDDEIIDPFGRSPYHYRLVQSQIGLAVSNLIKTLQEKK